MSLVMICDRCEAKMEPTNHPPVPWIHLTDGPPPVDLCNDCRVSFNEWWDAASPIVVHPDSRSLPVEALQ